MKVLPSSLKELFRPLAAAASAVALAVPLVAASAPAAEAGVMNHGPTRIIMQQLEHDGYTPVGAGYVGADKGKSVLLAFFKKDNADWVATSGTDTTMEIVARGTDLTVSQWISGTEIAYEAPQLVQQQGPSCAPFDQVRDHLLKAEFPQAQLIEGKIDDGDTLQAYVSKDMWLALNIEPDQNTCVAAGGVGFVFAEPMTAQAMTH